MSAPRIPAELFPTGANVACHNPGPGRLAHRSDTVQREIPGRTINGQQMYEHLTVAACTPDSGPIPLVTAHWADHLGAHACTAQACFPTAATD